MNPYSGSSFFSFLYLFFSRLLTVRCFSDMACDEAQVFALVLLGISATFVGVIIFFRKFGMLANSVSHTSLLGIVCAFLINKCCFGDHESMLSTVMLASLLSAALTSFITYCFVHYFCLDTDTGTALCFSLIFSLGVLMVSVFASHTHLGLDIVMGDIELVSVRDLYVMSVVAFVNLLLFLLLKRAYVSVCFDEQFFVCAFGSSFYINQLIMIQLAITMISSLSIMGVFLPLGYIIGVPMLMSRISNSIGDIWKNSLLYCLFISIISVAISRHCLTVFGLAISTAAVSIVFMCVTSVIIFAFDGRK